MNQVKLSIIIPVLHFTRPLNKKRFFMPRQTIENTLADIQKNVSMPHEVIVICNGQDQELVDYIKQHPAITRYALNSQNAGVARSWNMGAQLATGEVLCYLNDDVSIGKDALETLYKHMELNQKIGQIGPTGAKWDGAEHKSFVGETHPEEADAIAGYCFLLRTSLFHELGGFDINFNPAGFEEIDMSFRVRKAGYTCYVIPNTDITHYHHHGVSAFKTEIKYLSSTIDTESLHERNKKYFELKWGLNA